MRQLELLPPIELDELVDRASLLDRFDRKYLLPVSELPVFLSRLQAGVRVLEIEGQRSLRYRSAYLDTPGLECYLDAARRRRRRFKLRVRTYVESDSHFLEVKTRGRRGRTVKQRSALRDDNVASEGSELLARSGIERDLSTFRHVLTVDYRRTTLFTPREGGRITIDTGLTWWLPGGPSVRTPELAVVETKSPTAGQHADRVLRALKHRPSSISKYGTGMAALRPDLPANRWRPVLRRHFGDNNFRR